MLDMFRVKNCPSEMTDLFLHNIERVEVVFEEFEFALLRPRVGGPGDGAVLFADLVQLHLELDDLDTSSAKQVTACTWPSGSSHLFTSVLQVLDEAFARDLKLGKVQIHLLAQTLRFAGRVGERFGIL